MGARVVWKRDPSGFWEGPVTAVAAEDPPAVWWLRVVLVTQHVV